jgi:glycosyltransferase involved in cell wall biosynthesis
VTTVVLPCLNEARTLDFCVSEIRLANRTNCDEIQTIVADNGSTDNSPAVAEICGATVVHVPKKGYGNAICGGVRASTSKFIVMGDADGSYNFADIPKFVAELENGADLVIGNRFGGGIMPGAMPRLHRYLGNPVLSWLGRLLFGCKVRDFHCGLRAFTREAFDRMNLRSPGMEFASEMIIKATLQGMRIAEVPTILRPDRRDRAPHLRTWRDGWRHLRFMLLLAPHWLFFVPGLFLATFGFSVIAAMNIYGRIVVGSVAFSVNTSIVAAMTMILGTQLICMGVFARRFAESLGIYRKSRNFEIVRPWLSLERGLLFGIIATAGGLVILVRATLAWRSFGFGELDVGVTLHQVIPAATAVMLGMETIFGSFFLSLLQFQEQTSETDSVDGVS